MRISMTLGERNDKNDAGRQRKKKSLLSNDFFFFLSMEWSFLYSFDRKGEKELYSPKEKRTILATFW